MSRSPEDLIGVLKSAGYDVEDLPNDRNDSSWNDLKGEPYNLSVPELSRLKNHLFPVQGMYDRIV
jgi:hypothetical protein